MSDEFRPIEVVGGGEPGPPPPARERTTLLLTVIAAGVVVGAVCLAITAWMTVQQQGDQRVLNCFYVTGSGFDDEAAARGYDSMTEEQQALVDRFGCDVPGR